MASCERIYIIKAKFRLSEYFRGKWLSAQFWPSNGVLRMHSYMSYPSHESAEICDFSFQIPTGARRRALFCATKDQLSAHFDTFLAPPRWRAVFCEPILAKMVVCEGTAIPWNVWAYVTKFWWLHDGCICGKRDRRETACGCLFEMLSSPFRQPRLPL